MKIQFCSGGNIIDGWENRDMDCDIRNPLPYKDESATCILIEHGLEHVTFKEGWNFLCECHRILKPKGVLRVGIPDITKMYRDMTPQYRDAVKLGGHGDGSMKSTIRAAIFEHGHQSVWNSVLLQTIMSAIGFSYRRMETIGSSSCHDLVDVEGHWRIVGMDIALVETAIVEGMK